MHSVGFMVALFLHVISFAIAFGSVVVVDCAGLFWLMRRSEFTLGRVLRVADVTQPLIWLGFVDLVLSGVYMQVEIGRVDATSVIKFGLVAALGLNGIALHRLKVTFSGFRDETTPHDVGRYMPAMALATAVSQLGWWGATVIGFAHAYTRGAVASPVSPVYALSIFYGVWIIALAAFKVYQHKATQPL